MTDDTGTNSSPGEAPAAPASRREDETPGKVALRYVASARRITKSNDGKPDERVTAMLASANVMALLELADAVRSSGQGRPS
jgi:hypothetical protein